MIDNYDEYFVGPFDPDLEEPESVVEWFEKNGLLN